jgi:hypothetical protein
VLFHQKRQAEQEAAGGKQAIVAGRGLKEEGGEGGTSNIEL